MLHSIIWSYCGYCLLVDFKCYGRAEAVQIISVIVAIMNNYMQCMVAFNGLNEEDTWAKPTRIRMI